MKKYDDHVDVEEPSSTPTKISMLISRQRMSPEIDPQPKPLPPDDHNTTTMISVPFKWEESPGKPRHCHTQSELTNSNSISRTTLELPPRLLFLEANKVAPSPTTTRLYLDDGPLLGRAMSFTTSYRTPRENWNSNFGSSRWTGFRKINQEEEKEEKDGDEDEGSVVFSNHCNAKSKKAKVKKITKGGSSFSLLSNKAKSHLWASIYESFKQVVPWRRRKETQGKWPSKTHTV